MTTPLSVAARLLGRLLNPAPALIVVGSLSVSPAIVAEARASDDWQFSGFHDSSHFMNMHGAQPSISSRDLRLFADVLDFDETQEEIMTEVYAEFLRAYNREWTLNAERRSDARVRQEAEGGHGWHQTGFPELEEQFEATTERLESDFLADVRLLLSSEQSERWPDLERERRRLQTLSAYAAFPVEKIDLVVSVQSLNLDESTTESLGSLLDEYRLQVDAALVPRNAKARSLGDALQALQVKQDEARNMQNPMDMGDVWGKIREEQQELVPQALELYSLCERLRDINLHYQARIEEQLPPDAVETFRELTTTRNRGMLGWMFRAQQMLQSLEMIARHSGGVRTHSMNGVRLEVPELTDEQKQQIESVREDFEAKRSSLFARHMPNGWSASEPAYINLSTPRGQVSLRRRMEARSENNVSRYVNGVPISDELQSGMAQLDQDIVDRLREILTIEQRQIVVPH